MWYTIKPGDSLSLIAQKYLGSLMLFNDIAEANPGVIYDVNIVVPGTKIWIPINGQANPNITPFNLEPHRSPAITPSPYTNTFSPMPPTEVTEDYQSSQPDGFLRITDPEKFNRMMTYGGLGLVAVAALILLRK